MLKRTTAFIHGHFLSSIKLRSLVPANVVDVYANLSQFKSEWSWMTKYSLSARGVSSPDFPQSLCFAYPPPPKLTPHNISATLKGELGLTMWSKSQHQCHRDILWSRYHSCYNLSQFKGVLLNQKNIVFLLEESLNDCFQLCYNRIIMWKRLIDKINKNIKEVSILTLCTRGSNIRKNISDRSNRIDAGFMCHLTKKASVKSLWVSQVWLSNVHG